MEMCLAMGREDQIWEERRVKREEEEEEATHDVVEGLLLAGDEGVGSDFGFLLGEALCRRKRVSDEPGHLNSTLTHRS